MTSPRHARFGSHLDHSHILRCQPRDDLGPVIRLSSFPGLDGLHRNYYVRKSVTNHSFNDEGEVSPEAAEIVQQLVTTIK